MRLGGPVAYAGDPEAWAAEARRRGYSAVYFPSGGADDSALAGIVKAAEAAGLVIAEVGAWSNPLSPDEATRKRRAGEVPRATRPGRPRRRALLRQHRRLARPEMGRPACR